MLCLPLLYGYPVHLQVQRALDCAMCEQLQLAFKQKACQLHAAGGHI